MKWYKILAIWLATAILGSFLTQVVFFPESKDHLFGVIILSQMSLLYSIPYFVLMLIVHVRARFKSTEKKRLVRSSWILYWLVCFVYFFLSMISGGGALILVYILPGALFWWLSFKFWFADYKLPMEVEKTNK